MVHTEAEKWKLFCIRKCDPCDRFPSSGTRRAVGVEEEPGGL